MDLLKMEYHEISDDFCRNFKVMSFTK